MAKRLKQSTALTIQFGPFVDFTDGVTPETAVTPTIYLSKNGGTQAARNSATAITHDRDGYYKVHLDTTDTNTLGLLKVQASNSTIHAPVWDDFEVVPANHYDSLILGTDNLQVDAVEISSDSAAANNAESFFDGTGYAGTGNTIPTVTTLTNGVTVTTNNDKTGYTITSAEHINVADALLKRDWNSVTGEASRSVLNALRFLRNKWSISGSTLTVTEEDDSTTAWTGALTVNSAADPVTGSDPS